VRRAPTLKRDHRAHNTGYTRPNKRTKISLWSTDRPVPLTSSTIDNVNLRLRQDTGKVTMSSYLMRVDRRNGGAGRYAPIASFATLCHRRTKHINFRPSRDLTGDDETRGIRAPVSLNFVLLANRRVPSFIITGNAVSTRGNLLSNLSFQFSHDLVYIFTYLI